MGAPWDDVARETARGDVFNLWYEKSRPFLRPDLSRLDYESEFLQAVTQARIPLGQDAFAFAVQQADLRGADQVALVFIDDPKYVRLVVVCRELQRAAGPHPMFLSGDQVATLFGIHRSWGFGMLQYLQRKGVLKLVASGGVNKANRYFYLPNFPGKEPFKVRRDEDLGNAADLGGADHDIG
jgi:hypothetical protein